MEPSAENARMIESQKQDLERQIETVVREYGRENGGTVGLDLTMNDGEGAGGAPEDLDYRIRRLVEQFQSNPVISQNGVRVHKVTAIDSDGDGSIALKVSYDHPGY